MPDARPSPVRDSAHGVPELPRPLVTVEEVARTYSVKPRQVYEYAKSGVIPCIRLGKFLRFDLEAIARQLAEGRSVLAAAAPEPPASSERRRGRPRQVAAV